MGNNIVTMPRTPGILFIGSKMVDTCVVKRDTRGIQEDKSTKVDYPVLVLPILSWWPPVEGLLIAEMTRTGSISG